MWGVGGQITRVIANYWTEAGQTSPLFYGPCHHYYDDAAAKDRFSNDTLNGAKSAAKLRSYLCGLGAHNQELALRRNRNKLQVPEMLMMHGTQASIEI